MGRCDDHLRLLGVGGEHVEHRFRAFPYGCLSMKDIPGKEWDEKMREPFRSGKAGSENSKSGWKRAESAS